jgi:hypothetical protein
VRSASHLGVSGPAVLLGNIQPLVALRASLWLRLVFCGDFGTLVESFARNFMAPIQHPLIDIFGPLKCKLSGLF